jgi:hypothetical protein
LVLRRSFVWVFHCLQVLWSSWSLEYITAVFHLPQSRRRALGSPLPVTPFSTPDT